MSLARKLERFENEEKKVMTDFLLCMLKWLPTQRWSAEKLLEHEWLKL